MSTPVLSSVGDASGRPEDENGKSLCFTPFNRLATWGLIVLAGLVWSAITLVRHYSFASVEDLAMFDQMLWSVRNGYGLVSSISGNFHLMYPHHFYGEHVSPFLYLIAFPAGLTRGPEFLLVFQAFMVALSAWPAATWAAERWGRPGWRPAVAAAWLAVPGLWMGVFHDFHPSALMPLFYLMFLRDFATRRPSAWLWAIAFVSLKEDAPFYLAMTGLAAGWIFRRRAAGAALFAGALAYGILLVRVVIPFFSDSGAHLLADRLEGAHGLGPMIERMWALASDGVRWEWLFYHLSAFALLMLLAPVAALPAAFCAGIMWISSLPLQFKILIHYPFALYPLLFFAAVEGGRRLLSWFRWPAGRPWPALVFALLWCGGLFVSWRALAPEVGDLVKHTSILQARRMAPAHRLLASIPPDRPLVVDLMLSSHAARRRDLKLLFRPVEQEWIAVFLNSTHVNWRMWPWYRDLLKPDSPFGLRGSVHDQVVVLHRGSDPAANAGLASRLYSAFESEALYHDRGRDVADPEASGGWALEVTREDRAGYAMWGPDIDFEPGDYRVTFRLAVDAQPGLAVGELDVGERTPEKRICGRREVTGGVRGYQDLDLDVVLTTGRRVEFRYINHRKGAVRLDRVTVKKMDSSAP